MMLSVLLRASLEGAVLVFLVWIVTRACTWLSPGVRTMLWWAAAAKFLIAVVWVNPIAVPVLPENIPATPAVARATSTAPGALALAPLPFTDTDVDTQYVGVSRWGQAATAVWAVGLTMATVIGARRWRHVRTVIARSAAAPGEIQECTRELAVRLRLRYAPEVRLSDDVEAPLVAGVLRPTILLPSARFDALSGRQQELTLCHELAHVKRADLWLGCVPAVAERLFFFHPLAHTAAREYALWREAACDARVLDVTDATPQEYGRLLLALGVARRPTALVAAGSAWSVSNLTRRITMLNQTSAGTVRGRVFAAAAVGVALLALVPLKLVARQSGSEGRGLGVGQVGGLSPGSGGGTGLESRAAPGREGFWWDLAPREQGSPRRAGEINYVFFRDDTNTMMSGSMEDIRRAKPFKRSGEPLLWFRQDGREYVIRDRSLLSQIEAAWTEVSAIGERQGLVGSKQGEIGALQGEIGGKQAEVGGEQAKVGGRQASVGDRQARLAAREGWRSRTDAERRAFDADRRKLDEEMSALDKEMRFLDDKMRDLDRPMQDLDRKMRELDREMQVLDRQMQSAVAKAETELREHFARAIAAGAAERVD